MTTDHSDCCRVDIPKKLPGGPIPIKVAQAAPVQRGPDVLFWGTLLAVAAGYGMHLTPWAGGADSFSQAVFTLMNQMWVGIVIGIVAMGVVGRVPRPFIMAALGTRKGARGIFRAVLAGLLLDLCSHGILMIGAKLYERGATAGQLMAFLIASPWNSLSLTVILIALIGWGYTLLFIVLSALVALITGVAVDALVDRGKLPANPARMPLPEGFSFWREARAAWAGVRITPAYVGDTLRAGVIDSKMILRWLFVGVLIAAALRAFLDTGHFAHYFGPTLLGLGMTLIAATVIEVCSEGSAPVAADILTRAHAPGNAFTFMMAGVATDYTEIMVLREATKSWKVTLMLPLLTTPQVLLLGYLLN